MKILSLHLHHFRNIAQAQLDFDPVQTLLIGANGQGKTNVLEALYVGSHARSFRTANERELIQHGQPKAQLQLVLDTPQGLTDLDITWTDASVLDPTQPKRLKVGFTRNGVILKSRSQLLGTLPTVSFFVSDLLLLRGAPDDRRRWLDAAVVQYDPRHFAWLAEFNKVRQHKSQLLKQPPEQLDFDHLAAWNQRLAQTAAWVMAARLQYLAMISPLVAQAYQGLSAHTQQPEDLSLAYVSPVVPHSEASRTVRAGNLYPVSDQLETTVTALNQALLQKLADRQSDEIRRGVCLVGPHRDDIRFDINSYDAAAFGSQGQQRSIVLAAKVAELRALQTKLNDAPVLLLDDVMAELDPDRQARLMDCWVPGVQKILTTTHTLPGWANAHVLQVARGRVTVADALNISSDLEPVMVMP
jgi:DNA replication and repair protein RecF